MSRTQIKEGSIIEAITKDEKLQGILMPNPDKKILSIKLNSGYNIGIDKNKIKKIKLIKKSQSKETEKEKKLELNKNLPIISILHTGGTIASKVDYNTGAVTPKFSAQDIVSMFPELKEIANIKSRLIKQMWSQDMRFYHYNLIAKEIEKEIKSGTDGIIITHGTDTLHFTSSALSFILQDLPIPVILVGAQRSSDRGSTDAALNLINAAYFIANTDFNDVAICMHKNMDDNSCLILPSTKTRKMHTSRRDAFKAINDSAWADVDYKNKRIEFIKNNYKKKSNSKLKLKLFKENIKVAILKQFTNMRSEQFLFFKNYDGLVIEASGLGNLPTSEIDQSTKEHLKIFNALKTLIKNNVIVVLSPQTINGRLNLNVYENQRKIKEIGILGDLSDMTTETSYIKLAWLLSNYPKKEVKNLFLKNLHGEISERTLIEQELE